MRVATDHIWRRRNVHVVDVVGSTYQPRHPYLRNNTRSTQTSRHVVQGVFAWAMTKLVLVIGGEVVDWSCDLAVDDLAVRESR